MSLLLTLTKLIHNPSHMKRLIMHSSMIWLKRRSIMIWIQDQPGRHQRELGEAHRLSLSGNVLQHISSKHAKKEDYIMVDALPTISKSGTEYAK